MGPTQLPEALSIPSTPSATPPATLTSEAWSATPTVPLFPLTPRRCTPPSSPTPPPAVPSTTPSVPTPTPPEPTLPTPTPLATPTTTASCPSTPASLDSWPTPTVP